MNALLRRDILTARPSRPSIPYIVLFAGLVASAATGFYGDRLGDARDRIRFDGEADQVRFTVSNRIDTYVALLRSASGLFAASEEVTRTDFFRFIERLDLRARYPGIQGIGFARRIPAADLGRAVARIRASGDLDFRVWPSYPRDEYHAIVYLEPLDRRNRAAIGYDMYTEPIRREAMDASARKGGAAALGEGDAGPGDRPAQPSGGLPHLRAGLSIGLHPGHRGGPARTSSRGSSTARSAPATSSPPSSRRRASRPAGAACLRRRPLARPPARRVGRHARRRRAAALRAGADAGRRRAGVDARHRCPARASV